MKKLINHHQAKLHQFARLIIAAAAIIIFSFLNRYSPLLCCMIFLPARSKVNQVVANNHFKEANSISFLRVIINKMFKPFDFRIIMCNFRIAHEYEKPRLDQFLCTFPLFIHTCPCHFKRFYNKTDYCVNQRLNT